MLAAAFNLAFWCMLRVDEVLKIKMSHIKIEGTLVTLTLPYRKTHQFGGRLDGFRPCFSARLIASTEIKPFHLHLQLNDDAYLCPVRALADWISVSEIQTGYLFRRMDVSDRVTEKPMVRLA